MKATPSDLKTETNSNLHKKSVNTISHRVRILRKTLRRHPIFVVCAVLGGLASLFLATGAGLIIGQRSSNRLTRDLAKLRAETSGEISALQKGFDADRTAISVQIASLLESAVKGNQTSGQLASEIERLQNAIEESHSNLTGKISSLQNEIGASKIERANEFLEAMSKFQSCLDAGDAHMAHDFLVALIRLDQESTDTFDACRRYVEAFHETPDAAELCLDVKRRMSQLLAYVPVSTIQDARNQIAALPIIVTQPAEPVAEEPSQNDLLVADFERRASLCKKRAEESNDLEGTRTMIQVLSENLAEETSLVRLDGDEETASRLDSVMATLDDAMATVLFGMVNNIESRFETLRNRSNAIRAASKQKIAEYFDGILGSQSGRIDEIIEEMNLLRRELAPLVFEESRMKESIRAKAVDENIRDEIVHCRKTEDYLYNCEALVVLGKIVNSEYYNIEARTKLIMQIDRSRLNPIAYQRYTRELQYIVKHSNGEYKKEFVDMLLKTSCEN